MHPLADELATSDGHAMRRILLEAIEELRPAQITPATQAHARRQQHLVLRYIEGLSPTQVARALTVSPRQASRDLQQALHELTVLLWGRVATGWPSRTEVRPMANDVTVASADVQQVVRGALSTLRKLLGAGGDRKLHVRVAVPDTLPPWRSTRICSGRRCSTCCCTWPAARRGRDRSSARPKARAAYSCGSASKPDPVNQFPFVPASASEEARALLDSGQQLVGMLGGDLEVGHDLAIALPAVGGYKLLVVDDNPDVGGLFRRYLRGEGYRVLQATSGAAALRLAREFRPHLVLLDVLLPTRDGWEIMSDLRSTPGMAETPVVICSVLPQEAMARSLQAADFLPKPVTRQSLLALLERWRPPPERTAPPGHS